MLDRSINRNIRGVFKPLFSFFLAAFLFTSLFAEDHSKLNELLPSENELEGIKKEGEARIFSGYELYDYINGGAEIYYHYDFCSVITQDYALSGETMVVDIFKMANPERASGIFNHFRKDFAKSIDLNANFAEGDMSIIGKRDRYFIKVQAFTGSNQIKSTMKSLFEKIVLKISAKSTKK